MSSVISGSGPGFGSAAYSVDGNTMPFIYSAGCANSAYPWSNKNPWWTVDFGETKHISAVNILNRGDC